MDGTTRMGRDESRDPAPVRTMRIEFSLRSIFGLIAIAAALWLLVQLWQIVLLLVIAVVLAGTLNPLVDWLVAHRVHPHVALGLIILALVLAVVGLAALVVPALVAQVVALATSAPALQQRLADILAPLPVIGDRVQALRDATPTQFLVPAATGILPYASLAAEGIALGLTTVVLAFYLLAERQRSLGFLYAVVPRRYHVRTARILLDMETIVGGYVRGQALTSAVIGIFMFALLWLVGTPNPLALAIFAAFTDLIPFIGGILVLVPAVLATLAVGLPQAGIVLVAILLYQEFESRVLIPRVYGQTLRLSAVAVTVALLVGGKLLGIVGALLALPLAAGVRVLVEDLRIDLPGEVTGEEAERATEERAETEYERRTAGASAAESAVVATALAEQLQETREAETGRAEVPLEERADTPAGAGLPRRVT